MMSKHTDIYGMVMCGGQSSRMGSDKGLMKSSQGITWAQYSADLLSHLDIPVLVSVNRLQQHKYSALFPSAQLIFDATDLDVKGPLLGLLSAHQQYPSQDLFVLACDMPHMQTSVLQHLYAQYLQFNNAEAYIFTNDKEAEPLCAIYTGKGLQKILDHYHSKQLHKFSMKHILDHLHVHTVEIPGEWKSCFSNMNTAEDLRHLQ